MGVVGDELQKSSRTEEEQLKNEIYLLKEASCRLSKRLVLLENFIKNKFVDEFPPPPFEFLGRSTRSTKNTTLSSSVKKSEVTAPIRPRVSALSALEYVVVYSSEAPASSPSGKNQSISNRENNTDINKGFLRDSEEPGIDRKKSSSTASVDGSLQEEEDNSRNKYTENKLDGLSSVGAEVEIKHHGNDDRSSDDDDNSKDMDYKPPDEQLPCPSPGYEVEIDKTEEETMNWLNGEHDSTPSTDNDETDDETSKKYNVTRNRTRIRNAAPLPQPRSITINRTINRKIYHVCHICKRVFNAPQTLRRHMDIHSTIRKYKCNICDKTFQQQRPLVTHRQRVHEFEKYAVHLCQYCGKKFVTVKEQLQHERVHTGEKPYVCEICGFSCTQKTNLVRHKLAHLPEKDVLCPECGKVFTGNHQLKRHTKNIHQGEFGPDGKKLKTIICEICNAAYSNVGGLKIHMYRVHGEKRCSIKPKPQILITVQDNPGLSKETTEAVNSIIPE